MIAILRRQRIDNGGRQYALLTQIGAYAGLECRHRIEVGAPCRIKPTLQGRQAEADRQAGGRVLPCLTGQFQQGRVQLARFRWCRQQVTDDREAQPRPAITIKRIVSNCHVSSQRGGETFATDGKTAYLAVRSRAITKLCGRSAESTGLRSPCSGGPRSAGPAQAVSPGQ